MAKENYSNNGITTLSAAITSTSSTSITVSTGSNYAQLPTTGQFRILIDSELLLVTANNGSGTLTVTRGVEGTIAATHSNGASVTAILTDQSLRNLVRIDISGTNQAVRRELNFIPGSMIGISVSDDPTNDKADISLTAYDCFTWALAIGTAAVIGTDLANWAIVDRSYTLTKCFIAAKTAPTGANLVVDILRSTDNGATWTSLWATNTSNRPTITASNHTGTTTSFDTTGLNEGNLLRIDIVTVGSTVAGQDITVKLKGN